MPAATDPLPLEIEILRRRRRTVELRLEHGRLRARVPLRISKAELDSLLPELREKLWDHLSRHRVFHEARLRELSLEVAARHLVDLDLPPFTVHFSRRQQKRWGSCTLDSHDHRGSIRISDRLRGHPNWVLEHLLLHELIHLVVGNHGQRFYALLARDPHHERAEAYLEALENVGLLGERIPSGESLLAFIREEVESNEKAAPAAAVDGLPLFGPRQTLV